VPSEMSFFPFKKEEENHEISSPRKYTILQLLESRETTKRC